ncbi:MAG: hypothetical protein AB7J35_21385 [Dehalococcoidia bacterium]
MAFTSEQVEEFIATLRDNPGLRERVRGAILSDDFQALPGAIVALSARLDVLTTRLDALVQRFDAFAEAVDARLSMSEKRLDDIAGKLGNLEGHEFEGRFIRNLRSHIGPRFRRPRPFDVYSDESFDTALKNHPLSEAELKDIATADLLVWATDSTTGGDAVLVLEISQTVDPGDVFRAERRSSLLNSAGLNAIGVVAGAAISHDGRVAASAKSIVTLIQQAAEDNPAA